MSALRRLSAEHHQRGVVRQKASARPAVENREPATDDVRILEEAIVAPELAQGSDSLLSSGDRTFGHGLELDGAIGAEDERLNLVCRHRTMNLEGQVQGARKEGVTEVGRLVVREGTQLGSFTVDDHETVAKRERGGAASRDQDSHDREQEVV